MDALEIQARLRSASPETKALILLGINTGGCRLWPETEAALREAGVGPLRETYKTIVGLQEGATDEYVREWLFGLPCVSLGSDLCP